MEAIRNHNTVPAQTNECKAHENHPAPQDDTAVLIEWLNTHPYSAQRIIACVRRMAGMEEESA